MEEPAHHSTDPQGGDTVTPVVADAYLENRARTVAGVFRILAAAVLILWIIGAIFALIAGIATGAEKDAFFTGLLAGILGACLALVYGIISWAGVMLLSLIARFIANRS